MTTGRADGLRVGVAGGGIGGLTLAHALIARGATVTVFDRDRYAEDTAGYRLHLTAESLAVLVATLPGKVADAVRSRAAPPDTFTHFSVLDHRGRTRARLPMPAGERLLIGRQVLRATLAQQLDGVVHWRTAVQDYREERSGVTVLLADGGRAQFDVLVGADGTRSRVAHRLLGRPPTRQSGVTAIAGTVLTAQHPKLLLPVTLETGLGIAVGPRGVNMFLALHRPAQPRSQQNVNPEPSYVVWSVFTRIDRFSADPGDMSDDELIAEATSQIRGWDRRYLDLIDHSEATSMAAIPFVFPSTGPIASSKRVTLIGDAAHAMPPTAGAGASTAINDAAHLADALNQYGPDEALRRFTTTMNGYAPTQVAKAVPILAWQQRLRHPALRIPALALGLPAASTVLRIGRRLR